MMPLVLLLPLLHALPNASLTWVTVELQLKGVHETQGLALQPLRKAGQESGVGVNRPNPLDWVQEPRSLTWGSYLLWKRHNKQTLKRGH